MTMASMQATPSPVNSESDKESLRAIGEQKERVQALDRGASSASFWNHVVLGAAALIAVLIVVVSQWGRRADRRVREAEGLLNALEMTKITVDAQAEAERIETKSEKEINVLKRAASDAEREMLEQKGRTASLEKEAAEAKAALSEAKITQLRTEENLEETKAKTIDALTKADEAKLAALKGELERERMTRESYPRKLNILEQEKYLTLLRKYAGTEVYFVTVPDTEPLRTAQMLKSLLMQAGWKVLRIETKAESTEAEISSGISIESNRRSSLRVEVRPAMEAIHAVLMDSQIVSMLKPLNPWLPPDSLPLNTFRIVIGLQPDRYFDWQKQKEEWERSPLRPETWLPTPKKKP